MQLRLVIWQAQQVHMTMRTVQLLFIIRSTGCDESSHGELHDGGHDVAIGCLECLHGTRFADASLHKTSTSIESRASILTSPFEISSTVLLFILPPGFEVELSTICP